MIGKFRNFDRKIEFLAVSSKLLDKVYNWVAWGQKPFYNRIKFVIYIFKSGNEYSS